jgi:DNA-directed RNA polymerase specialized sigma24 family protein
MDRMSPPRTAWVLTQETFDGLLLWLDPDRDRAGQLYGEIQGKLIKIFARRGCPIADELADETINRVAKKLAEIQDSYVGDPALYFYGVGNKVFLEYVRKRPEPLPLPTPEPPERIESSYQCLEKCLAQAPPSSRNLFLEYFRLEKPDKIEHRRALAQRLGISINALRTRAHRIRTALQQCLAECVERSAG